MVRVETFFRAQACMEETAPVEHRRRIGQLVDSPRHRLADRSFVFPGMFVPLPHRKVFRCLMGDFIGSPLFFVIGGVIVAALIGALVFMRIKAKKDEE